LQLARRGLRYARRDHRRSHDTNGVTDAEPGSIHYPLGDLSSDNYETCGVATDLAHDRLSSGCNDASGRWVADSRARIGTDYGSWPRRSMHVPGPRLRSCDRFVHSPWWQPVLVLEKQDTGRGSWRCCSGRSACLPRDEKEVGKSVWSNNSDEDFGDDDDDDGDHDVPDSPDSYGACSIANRRPNSNRVNVNVDVDVYPHNHATRDSRIDSLLHRLGSDYGSVLE